MSALRVENKVIWAPVGRSDVFACRVVVETPIEEEGDDPAPHLPVCQKGVGENEPFGRR